MPKYSKKEFADLCEIKTKHLSTYISRSEVVLDGNLIDGDHETNKYFIEKRRSFNSKKNVQPIIVPEISNEQKLNNRTAEKNTKEAQSQFEFPKEHPAPTKNFQLDEQIKEQELEKSKINTQLLNAKLAKINGDNIPTELAKNVVVHLAKNITVAFHSAADNILMEFAKKKDIDITEMADLRGKMVGIINVAVNDSIEESKKTVHHIVSEHSQRKEVGERE